MADLQKWCVDMAAELDDDFSLGFSEYVYMCVCVKIICGCNQGHALESQIYVNILLLRKFTYVYSKRTVRFRQMSLKN